MSYYIGLDISLKQTNICVLDADKAIVFESTTSSQVASLDDALKPWLHEAKVVGLETGATTPYLARGLRAAGYPVQIIEARRAADALRARAVKTDKKDALALAQMLYADWFTSVHLKSEQSHECKAVLTARDQLVSARRDLGNQIRGLLKPFGKTIAARLGTQKFDDQARAASQDKDTVYLCVDALLRAMQGIEEQLKVLDDELQKLGRSAEPIERMLSVPGVGVVTAMAFIAAIDDPSRFSQSDTAGAYIGLTPRRYQSGTKDVSGAISKQGDSMARHLLYEAANSLLTAYKGACALKDWGLKLMDRVGAKKARVAVARKLANLLLRLWQTGEFFEPYPTAPKRLTPTNSA